MIQNVWTAPGGEELPLVLYIARRHHRVTPWALPVNGGVLPQHCVAWPRDVCVFVHETSVHVACAEEAFYLRDGPQEQGLMDGARCLRLFSHGKETGVHELSEECIILRK